MFQRYLCAVVATNSRVLQSERKESREAGTCVNQRERRRDCFVDRNIKQSLMVCFNFEPQGWEEHSLVSSNDLHASRKSHALVLEHRVSIRVGRISIIIEIRCLGLAVQAYAE